MAEVRQKVDLDLAGSIAGLERTAALVGDVNAKIESLGKSSKTAFTNVADVADNYNKSLGDGVKVYGQIDGAAKKHQTTVQGLTGNMERLDNSMKSIGAKGAQGLKATNTEATKLDKSILQLRIKMQSYQNIVEKATDTKIIDRYNKKLEETERKIQQLSNRGKKGFDELGNSVKKQEGILQKFGGAIAGVFAVGAILAWAKQIGSAILEVTAQFQKFEAVLTTSLGSKSAAQRAMGMIQDFAASTPYAINELTDSFVKLAGRGIRATTANLTKMGDVAAASGKGLDQLTEAILDINNQERWKEFGIKVKTEGDKVIGSFRGMTVEVEKTEAGALKMIEAFGGMEGVAGSMEAISQTLTGQMSNLGDSIDKLFLTIGNQEAGGMATFLSFLSDAVGWMTELVATTDQLGQMRAAPFVEDFVANVEPRLKQVAQTAKDTNADVSKALKEESAELKKTLERDLAEAQRILEEFGPARGWNREKRANLAGNVAKLSGQLNAIADMERQIVEDIERKAEADRLKREEKQAELDKKAAALREKAKLDLIKLFESLENQAAKARIDMLDKNSKAYLDAVRKYEQEQVAALEKAIRDKQKAAGLSSDLTTEQQEQIRILAQQVDKKYYDALYKQQEQQRDKLLQLQKDSDAKELEQITRKYDAEIRAAEEAGQREIAIALNTAKQVELAKTKRKQAEKNVDYQEQLSKEGALLDINSMQGISEVEREKLKKEKLLELEIEFAQKKLAIIANETDDESILRQLQFKNLLKELNNQKEAAQAEANKFSLQKLLGLDDEQMKAVEQAFGTILSQVQEYTANMVALREREVQSLTRQMDEKGRELDREIALNREGFASNVATKQQEYETLKAQREKAIADQRKAQQTQILLDSALQVSNLITSSSEIFKVLSKLGPIGVALAIGTIATMFGTFAAAKSKAVQATKVPTYKAGGEGSMIQGASHDRGGIDIVERQSGRVVGNMQGGENFYVTNNKATDEFWPLLQYINKQDKQGVINYALSELLNGTGVLLPNPETPKRLQVLQTGTKTAAAKAVSEQYFKDMNKHLKTISHNTKQQEQVIETETEITKKRGNYTRIILKDKK